ncbi:MAG: VanZ family protein [Candidatus Binataceae bacterium]|nr:VanZ family protein [Candidatus Binataceae bacterium]
MTTQSASGFSPAADRERPRRLRRYWIAPAICAAIILGLGSPLFSLARTRVMFDPMFERIWPHATYDMLYYCQELIRWTAHFSEYAILFVLLNLGPLRGRPVAAFAACVALAALDESLQLLTPARSGTIRDVALDSSGAATILVVWMPYWDSLRQHRMRRGR